MKKTKFFANVESFFRYSNTILAKIYMLKVRNIRTRRQICSKLTMKTPERHLASTPSVFIVNFEHISHLAIVFLLFTLKM